MTLPKHLRPRWRYLAVAFHTWPDATVTRELFDRAVRRSARSVLGDIGTAQMDLKILAFSYTDGAGTAVVRTRRETVQETRAAIACVSEIDGQPLGVHIRGTSGTVRSCEENYLGRETEELPENTVVFEGAERPAILRGADIDVRVGKAFVGATRLDLE